MMNIKIKLWFAFLISLAAISTAAWYAYNSFSSLVQSVHTLSERDTTVQVLNNLVNELVSSENNMRNYMATSDTGSLREFKIHNGNIENELAALQNSPLIQKNSQAELTQLNALLQKKTDLIISLLEVKKNETKNVAGKTMKKISSAINQPPVVQTYPDTTVSEPQIKQLKIPPLPSVEKKEKGGLFKRSPKKEKTQAEEPVTSVIISDTVKNVKQFSENVIAQNPIADPEQIRQVLIEMDNELKAYKTSYTQKELELLASDKIIMQRIRDLVNKIQVIQNNNLRLNTEFAYSTAQYSSRIIFYISIASLLAGIILMTIIISDINKNNRYKKQLEEARSKAEYLAKAKEQFLATMSHEIRTPLNAIVGFSDQLKVSAFDSEQKDFVKAVKHASEHLLNIVNDILEISKIEAGKIKFQKNIFSVSEVIEDVMTIMRMKAEEKKIFLEFLFDDNSKYLIRGDDFRLKQVLFNLLGNAIKFTGEDGYVTVTCSSKLREPYIDYFITVQDTGIGIPKNKLQTVFEDFTQADSSTTRKYGGTGLGLSITRRLIELQKGSIQVESIEGEGSKFSIAITYHLPNEKEIKTQTIQPKRTYNITKQVHVLVVDDEIYNLHLAEIILVKNKIQFSGSTTVKEALEKFNTIQFDIVFTDLHMPGEDGSVILKKIREINKDIPVVAFTADVMNDGASNLKESGFSDLLIKPYKEEDLLDKIMQWCKLPDIFITAQLPGDENKIVLTNGKLYSLDEINQFAENDMQILSKIIQTFVESNAVNIDELMHFAATGNIKGINAIAHKMLPLFIHFHILEGVENLKYLERANEFDADKINNAVENIISICEKVIPELEKEIKDLTVKQEA